MKYTVTTSNNVTTMTINTCDSGEGNEDYIDDSYYLDDDDYQTIVRELQLDVTDMDEFIDTVYDKLQAVESEYHCYPHYNATIGHDDITCDYKVKYEGELAAGKRLIINVEDTRDELYNNPEAVAMVKEEYKDDVYTQHNGWGIANDDDCFFFHD